MNWRLYLARCRRTRAPLAIFALTAMLYAGLAWLVCGGSDWWVLDHVGAFNVFYGDDAYRFFLARSAWLDAELYAYNFMLPGALILDGIVVTLAGESLFVSRLIHALLAAAGLAVLYATGRSVCIGRGIMLSATAVLALMPFYAMTSLSFYGEYWLALLVMASMLALVKENSLLLAVLAGLMPLVRPEGIYYLGAVWFQFVARRQWRPAVLSLLPGFVYFMFLLFYLPSFFDFGLWRLELRSLLEKVPLAEAPFRMVLTTFSPLLWLPALLGLLYRPVYKLWPVLAGAGVWLLYLATLMLTGLSDLETRYLYPVMPVLTLLWAAGIAWLGIKTSALWGRRTSSLISASLAVLVVAGHLDKMTHVQKFVQQEGRVELVRTLLSGRAEEVFPRLRRPEIGQRQTMATQIEEAVRSDAGINKVVIFYPQLYYHLDPRVFAGRATVAYPAMGYLVFHVLLDGQVFAQHPGGKMYSYLRFGLPTFRESERRALYADMMPMPDYPYRWQHGEMQLYLFSYREALTPEVDLEKVPPVMHQRLKEELLRWEI